MTTIRAASLASLALATQLACGAPPLETEVESEARARVPYDGPSRAYAGDLRDLAQSADLVFRGVVLSKTYRESQAGRGLEGGIPHTFVTYRIDEVYAGAAAGRQITLRFEGGLHADGRRFTNNPHYPLFDVQDEDVLFVVGNGQRSCPLVGCAAGRIRLIDGKALSDDGFEYHAEGGAISRGDFHHASAITDHQILGDRGFTREAPPIEQRRASRTARRRAPVGRVAIDNLARAAVRDTRSSRRRRRALSASPRRAVQIRDRRTSPPAVSSTPVAPRQPPPDSATRRRGAAGSRYLSR